MGGRGLLPLYFSIISCMVPLSLWAAWGIYRRPMRYRTFFPHNEARKHAVAGLLLTVLFFLPFFSIWLNEVFLLALGGVYGFLFVPLLVGLVRPNLAEQAELLDRLHYRLHKIHSRLAAVLWQLWRLLCLLALAGLSLVLSLPRVYSRSRQLQAALQQATFSLAASSLLTRPSFLPHHLAMLLLLLPAARHSPTSRLGRAAQVLAGGLVVALAVRIQFLLPLPHTSYLLLCTAYFCLTDPAIKGEEYLVGLVSHLHLDWLDQLEFLYVPLAVRLILLSTSLALLLTCPLHPLLLLSSLPFLLLLPGLHLHSQLLAPLQQELRGLKELRQPSAEELASLEDTCPVCLDTMRVARVTQCGHVFHAHCIRRCMAVSKSCPCCRAPLL